MENTNSPTNQTEARERAVAILTDRGFRFNIPTIEFVNDTTGERGRLAFFPVFEGGQDTGMVKGVALQTPGRKPTAEDLRNRVSTIGGFVNIWGETVR